MIDSIAFLELAQDELDDTFHKYQFQQKDLGYSFLKEIKTTLQLIKHYPNIGSKSSAQTQKFVLKSFPYAILFQRVNDSILVLAIMSLHKKPIHWATKSVSQYSTSRISILPETLYIR
jgi:plasmid stabilization system protein ParE